MLYHEFNMDKALAVRYEEGREEGMEMGMEKVFTLMDKGYSSAEIKKAPAKKQ
jgi:hypothetical protein